MELKVWVEGIQRVVCGVTEVTTCQDVVYALAHATGKTGRFTLMERWRNSERLLAPHEHPLRVLLKWGEYASDVQFILHRTALDTKAPENSLTHHRTMPQLLTGGQQKMANKALAAETAYRSSPQLPLQNKDIKKSLTFSGVHAPHLHSSGDSTNSSPVGGPEVGGVYNQKGPLSPHPSQNPSTNPVNSQRHPVNMNRPPAPPPYEFVRGNPPPPPLPASIGSSVRFYPSSNPLPFHPNDRMPFRSTMPPSHPSRGHPYPNGPRSRELPPYRDPPPPPPPSHPSLVRISPPDSAHPTSLPHSHSQPEMFRSSPIEQEVSKYPFSAAQRVSSAVIVPLSTSQQWNPYDNNLNSHPLSKQVPVSSSVHPGNELPVNVSRSQTSNVPSNKSKREDPSKENCDPVGSSGNHLTIHSEPPTCDRTQGFATEDPNPLRPVSEPPGHLTHKHSASKNSPVEPPNSLGHPNSNPVATSHANPPTEEVVLDAYYKELVKLVNEQRERITAQHVQLTQFEAEIAFFEGHFKEDESKLNYFRKEIQRLESIPVNADAESTKMLVDLEEELKRAKETESSSLEELSAFKSKIGSIDRQVSQMKARFKSIEEAFESEHRKRAEQREEETKTELDQLQSSLDLSTDQLENNTKMARELNDQVEEAETRLEEKKRELEKMKQSMREANLDALAMVPPEEGKAFAEGRTGSIKSGSSRRMVGSPRQLETAVPTAKNPHGVWV